MNARSLGKNTPAPGTILVLREGRAMASPLRMTVAAPGEPGSIVDRAWEGVVTIFERAEATMSRFREDSELTLLNRRAPGEASASRDLVRALVAADRARRVTGGRFDPRIVDALERIGYAGVPQGSGSGSLTGADPWRGRILQRRGRRGPIALGVPVDLGGIGKGLALRWAARGLDRWLAGEPASSGYLLDAGGDIVASGSPDGAGPWTVGIEDPAGGPEPLAVVAIRDGGAIATSSVRRLRWEHDGRTLHHLIDPRTGEPGGEGLVAVTVAGPDPAWAEVWSKALFLEGARAIAHAARARGLAAWWIAEDGALEMTPAARVRTTWVASEA
jgi:thiamine biosynthesis lipoprotein